MSIQYCAWIQTHDLWNMSLLPLPLDQGSRPLGIFDIKLDLVQEFWKLEINKNCIAITELYR